MSEEQTTVVVQRYLEALAGDAPAEPIVRALLDRSVRRLQVLCANLLYRAYPRLMQPPVNLQPDELLSAVVERLLKALRAARPQTVREFFALANQHMRWELNDLARRLDNQPAAGELYEGIALSPPSSVSEAHAQRPAHAPGDRRPPGGRAGSLRPGAHPGDDAGRGRGGAGRVDQDGAATVESCASDSVGGTGRPPARRRVTARTVVAIGPGLGRTLRKRGRYADGCWENPVMSGDPRVRALLEEILESHRTPEEVCQACPELLTEVRDRLRRLRELEAEVDSLFPTTGSATGTA